MSLRNVFILFFLIFSFLKADYYGPSLAESGLYSWDRQVFSLGVNSNLINSKTKSSISSLGFDISNKATLKRIGYYEEGEIYWRGRVLYNIYAYSNSKFYNMEISLGIGLKNPLKGIFVNYYAHDLSFVYKEFTNESSLSDSYFFENGKHIGFMYSLILGKNLSPKFEMALVPFVGIFKGNILNQESTIYTIEGVKMPMLYKKYHNVAFEYELSYQRINAGDSLGYSISKVSFNININWKYNN